MKTKSDFLKSKTISKFVVCMLFIACCSLTNKYCSAQTQGAAINTTGASAAASAILDVSSTTAPYQGMLIPRIALTGTNDVSTISSPANSLLIYNTATAGTSPNNITPGFYYFDATAVKWIQFNTGASAYDPTNLYLNIGR